MGVPYPHTRERLVHLWRAIATMLPRLIDADTERVILFGSVARGDVRSTSDLDLLVVRRDARRPAAHVDALYRRACPEVAVDLLVYTPEELEVAAATSGFIRHALREGEVLYDRSRALD